MKFFLLKTSSLNELYNMRSEFIQGFENQVDKEKRV